MDNKELLEQLNERFAHFDRLILTEFRHTNDRITNLSIILKDQGEAIAKQSDALHKQDKRLVKVEGKAAVFTKVAYSIVFTLVSSIGGLFAYLFTGGHKH